MKFNPNKSLGYPILGASSGGSRSSASDYPMASFQVDTKFAPFAETLNEFRLDYDFHVSVKGLEKAIKRGEAAYFLHIECPKTYFSRVEQVDAKGSLQIPRGKLRDKVKVSGFIAATKPTIIDSKQIADKFGTHKFLADAGMVLAYQNAVDHPVKQNAMFGLVSASARKQSGVVPARIILQRDVDKLRKSIAENLTLYRRGGFDKSASPLDEFGVLESMKVEEGALSRLNAQGGNKRDAENALVIFKSLRGLEPYWASDERLWAYLTHFPCRNFAWKRWFDGRGGWEDGATKRERDALAKDILEHFFARGSKGFVRGNAVSCLWWWAYIANRHEGAKLEKTLQVLLAYTDVREGVVGRPSLTRSEKVFSALMDVLIARYDADPQHTFFKRSKRAPYRTWLIELNRHAEVRILEAMSAKSLRELFEHLAVQAERG